MKLKKLFKNIFKSKKSKPNRQSKKVHKPAVTKKKSKRATNSKMISGKYSYSQKDRYKKTMQALDKSNSKDASQIKQYHESKNNEHQRKEPDYSGQVHHLNVVLNKKIHACKKICMDLVSDENNIKRFNDNKSFQKQLDKDIKKFRLSCKSICALTNNLDTYYQLNNLARVIDKVDKMKVLKIVTGLTVVSDGTLVAPVFVQSRLNLSPDEFNKHNLLLVAVPTYIHDEYHYLLPLKNKESSTTYSVFYRQDELHIVLKNSKQNSIYASKKYLFSIKDLDYIRGYLDFEQPNFKLCPIKVSND